MTDVQKQLLELEERINYLLQIKNDSDWGNLLELQENCANMVIDTYDHSTEELSAQIRKLNESITFLEKRAEENLSALERVRIARSIQRFSLRDILENVYDDYTELGGAKNTGIDPAMLCAKATITRKVKNKPYIASVMVIGQGTGHGEHFRNGGSCSPEGNEKALRYMKVAETEGVPIHLYIFTPDAHPTEEGFGAAQQVARNIYTMTKLQVPMVSMISEGGAAGAEAIGLTDYRVMCSHGYYSVISPERAAAIEGKIDEWEKIPKELIEVCAERLKLTAKDNLRNNTIDRILNEPILGARRNDTAFFAKLRAEMVRATDRVILSAKSFSGLRTYEVHRKKLQRTPEEPQAEVRWELNSDETKRLLELRSKKYLALGKNSFDGIADTDERLYRLTKAKTEKAYLALRYDVMKTHTKQATRKVLSDVSKESSVMLKRIAEPITALIDFWGKKTTEKPQRLITYSGNDWQQVEPPKKIDPLELTDTYTSPLANKDQTVTCPNAKKHGCQDLWIPDLYGDFAGVCTNCGHHFPLEYQWYLKNIFDLGSVKHFNTEISSINPLNYTGFTERLKKSKRRTGRRSGNMTFHAEINGIKIVVAMLYSDFRNGSVGSAEGEKFAQACAMAQRKKRPFLAYIHSTNGIRLQEGTLGLIQMPKCTMAAREYIDAGGLYLVVYDNNSYAGPVASFLGCSPYQFAIRSSRIGFTGPRVIRETTGMATPPDYHSAGNALKRGHIQGIWDRRAFKRHLYKSLITLGNPHLYYQ